MHKPKSDALAFSMLMLSCALVAWTGIAGPIFSESLWAGLDKWQTLLASIIALIAAYFAARPVYRQLAEQRRQSAAAAVTMIVKAAVAIEKERDIVRKGRDDLFRLDGILEAFDQLSWHDIYQTWPDQAYDLIETCDALLREMHRYRERNPKITSTQQCRIEAIALLEQVRSGIHDIRHIFRQDTSGLSYEHGEQDIPNDQHGLRRKQLDEARQLWASITERMDEALSKEISTVWQRIRHLEQIAIGGALDRL